MVRLLQFNIKIHLISIPYDDYLYNEWRAVDIWNARNVLVNLEMNSDRIET